VTNPDRRRQWRIVFLILETTLVLSGLGSALLQRSGDSRSYKLSPWEFSLGLLFGISTLLLLFGSPWFIRSLRGIALAGWILAFAGLVWMLLASTH
jgi:hypothetical protein